MYIIVQQWVHDNDFYIYTTSTLTSYTHSMGIIEYNLSSNNGDVKY